MTRVEKKKKTGLILFTNIQVAGRISAKSFLTVSKIFKSQGLHLCSSLSYMYLLLYCHMENHREPHTDQ